MKKITKKKTEPLKSKINIASNVTDGDGKTLSSKGVDTRIPERNTKAVGVNLGVTKNMGNYESLRVDVWCSKDLEPTDSYEAEFKKLSEVATDHLEHLLSTLVES